MKPLLKIHASAFFALIMLTGSAGAHEILGPAVVQASGDGHFAYEIAVIISDPIEFACCSLTDLGNTDVDSYHADGFCTTVIDPRIIVVPVEGKLVDLNQDGSVQYHHAMCDGWDGEITTRIEPPTVDDTTATWGAIKSRYR